MSFDYNPFNHLDVIHRPMGKVKLHCHGCGKLWGDWSLAVTAAVLYEEMEHHIVTSHARNREFFREWSDE